MQSFFVLPGQYEDLARDEVIAISKSYDSKTRYKVKPRLVILDTKVPWKKIAKRATFVRNCGYILDTFDDVSKLDLSIPKPRSFVCRTINLSTKNLSPSLLERQAGAVLKKKWNTKVSLSNPDLIIYLIITDSKQYIGCADSKLEPKMPVKTIKHPHELDLKLSRCIVNLSQLKEGDTLLDPFCGTGTILLQANSMGIKSIGIDYDEIMCKITRKNLQANGFSSKIINSTYHEMQNIRNKVDAIVTDLPYGISSKSSILPKKLIKDFVSMVPKRKKLVMVYKKGLDVQGMKKAKKYEIYRHKSLTRVIAVR
ncbi:MAG TPA: DNA methyltransferase [Candidatus Nitrosotalea sp.]|nr:DNA methyltransferase [Candidatus Nitrosotalea sp.]